MSYYAVHELSFDLPAATVTRANGGFTEANQSEVIGRWVQRSTGNTVILAADNAELLGVITRVTNNKVAVAVGPVVRGKRGPDAVLASGVSVVGATRKESASGTAERGFCKPVATSATSVGDLRTELSSARGYALGGGTATTVNTEGAFEDVLMWG